MFAIVIISRRCPLALIPAERVAGGKDPSGIRGPGGDARREVNDTALQSANPPFLTVCAAQPVRSLSVSVSRSLALFLSLALSLVSRSLSERRRARPCSALLYSRYRS